MDNTVLGISKRIPVPGWKLPDCMLLQKRLKENIEKLLNVVRLCNNRNNFLSEITLRQSLES